jgi:hypothetical protein
MSDAKENQSSSQGSEDTGNDYAEFEIGKDRVPWFLWVFFSIIIVWASISWIKFFGY